jgi:hypothetical protein
MRGKHRGCIHFQPAIFRSVFADLTGRTQSMVVVSPTDYTQAEKNISAQRIRLDGRPEYARIPIVRIPVT